MFNHLSPGTSDTRLICFPYLGGYSHAFNELANKLDSSIDLWAVNPPGHGGCPYPLVEDVEEVIDMYMKELPELLTNSTVLLGYSMGGIVVYHLMKRILSMPELKNKIPKKLIIFACGSPDTFTESNVSKIPDAQVVERIDGYGALPEKIKQNKAIMRYLMPIFRADCQVLDSAQNKMIEPFRSDVTFILGTNDQKIRIYMVTSWRNYFENPIQVKLLNGYSHMFIHDDPDQVAQIIEKQLF